MRRLTRLHATSATGADALPALRADLAAIQDEVAKTRPPAERVAAWQNDIRDLEAAAAASRSRMSFCQAATRSAGGRVFATSSWIAARSARSAGSASAPVADVACRRVRRRI